MIGWPSEILWQANSPFCANWKSETRGGWNEPDEVLMAAFNGEDKIKTDLRGQLCFLLSAHLAGKNGK